MEFTDAAHLGHLNLIEFCRHSATWGRNGAVQEHGGVLLFACDTDFPVTMNGVFRTDDQTDPATVLAQADAFFGARQRGYSVWIRDGRDEDLAAAASAAGLVEVLRTPEMVCLGRLPEQPLANGVEVRRVATVADVRAFATINDAAYAVYGMPPVLDTAFSAPARLLCPHVVAVIASVAGQPAAAAMTLASHGIAGVYWVGTLDQYRGRGLGEAVTRAVTNAGFDLGARINTLQASPMGAPIYLRMGYQTVFDYRVYVRFVQ